MVLKQSPVSLTEWDLFRAFLALFTTKSSDAAASQLGVSVVTLKRRIARLEDVLKTKLFLGYGSKFRMTAEGEDLAALLRNADRILAEIKPDLRYPDPRDTTKTSVWMMDALVGYMLIPWLQQSPELFRNYSLRVLTGPTPEVSQTFDFNLAFTHFSSESPQVRSISLGVHQVAFGCSPAYVDRYGLPNQENLSEHHLAIVEDYRLIRALWEGIENIPSQCSSFIEVDSTTAGDLLAKQGLYFTPVTQWSLSSDFIICPDLPVVSVPSYLLVSKAFYKTEMGRRLTQALIAQGLQFFQAAPIWPPKDGFPAGGNEA